MKLKCLPIDHRPGTSPKVWPIYNGYPRHHIDWVYALIEAIKLRNYYDDDYET